MLSTTELYRPPRIYPGQRLGRDEFYSLVSELEKRGERAHGIERLEGVVHMSAAVRADRLGEPQGSVITWLGTYAAQTTGTQAFGNATLKLDDENDPEPDAILRIRPEFGGQSAMDRRGYIEGPPELVVEIAGSTSTTDLQLKLEIYRRAGIREYLVWNTMADQFYWFMLLGTDYYRISPDDSGVLRSMLFPGLWLDVGALLRGDLAAVLTVLNAGLATSEHSQFVEQLAKSRRPEGPLGA